ncbi:helix-turn-helix domain-containing protein [Hamadaea tsunoensis]|uniref:helix-turn-helix domain-containing protein n=1 Tax=Hamadaea tsunoensis TaxID=53368 RepID=UPI0004100A26|nr:helix-turn-helix transcriptional regulator [Hamadaea tsunoensis]
MSEDTLGRALKRWRNQRRLSLRTLAERAHVSHVYVWEIEKDSKTPHHDVVVRFDDLLGAGGQLIAISAQHRAATSGAQENDLGLRFRSDWAGSIETVTSLWQHDATRRAFLRSAVYVSAAAVAPIADWLSSDDIGRDLDAIEGDLRSTDAVRAMTRTFRRLDNQYGGGEIRAGLVQYLDAEVGPALHHKTRSQLGATYLSAVAELTQLTGWLAYDSCQHGLAERYFIQALGLAQWAGDRALGAEILAGMSHQAIFIRKPNAAVNLARAAGRTAERAGVHALVAEASLMRAHAHAVAGEEQQTTSALTQAETVLAGGVRDADPHWIGYFDEAYLAAIKGHCFRELEHPALAREAAEQSLAMRPGYIRGQAFNELLLAGAHAQAGDVDQACAVGHRALDLASGMSSVRVIHNIDRLLRELRPWRTDRRVKALAERAAAATA